MAQIASMIQVIRISQSVISKRRKKKKAKEELTKSNTIIPALNALKSKEFDELLDEVSDETEEKDCNPSTVVASICFVSNIRDRFHFIRQLGKGSSCCVWKARNLQNNKIYAVKEMTKKLDINYQLFQKEVQLLKKLCHPNILQYNDCYEDDNNYYIATEFCSGGTLLENIVKMKSFSEQKASEYIKTILSAINYMHSLNIVHRDLKAPNLVFDKEGKGAVLKLIDFGDSKVIQDGVTYEEFVGTIQYVPPEILKKRTGRALKKSDIWSIGIITYLLVCGQVPFKGKNTKQTLKKIVSKKSKIRYPKNSQLTDSCKDFINGLLCRDVSKRLSAAKALQHPWICGNTASTKHLSTDFLRSLKEYNYSNKLQNILVDAMLTGMDDDEQETLNEGILKMNRQSSQMDGTSVVDYLLLHSAVDATEFKPDKSLFNVNTGIDWDCLNVNHLLNQFKWKDMKLEDMDDHAMFDMIDEASDDVDQEIEESTESSTSPIEIKSPSADKVNKRISVPRFKAIMKKSPKKYDVDQIVNDLHDGKGHIALEDVARYHKRVDTVKDVDLSSVF